MIKATCIIPVGPTNVEFLDLAVRSAVGHFDEIICCAAHVIEFHPDIQALPNQGVKLLISYNPSIAHQKNLCVVNARNEWISTLDSDDLYDDDGVEALAAMADDHNWNHDLYAAKVHEFGVGHLDSEWPSHNTGEAICNPVTLKAKNLFPVSSFFRKSLWAVYGGFRHIRYEDWDLWKRMMPGRWFHFNNFVFYHHRRWPGSIGGQTGWNSNLPLELPEP